ncbi:MAG: SUMF1/EgtB/PvdO family nonheme iron enzyme [Treponema sp.]|nr:SUMF1/EgtB/PvdO family nonheme iron enzyme [Treponema sp.]
MVSVQGGEFVMGNEFTGAHKVLLDDFYMANIPVTQALYKQVMKHSPAKIKGENKPVECVTWFDAIIFCNRFSLLEGKDPCYKAGSIVELDKISLDNVAWSKFNCNFNANGYRLPTEAEWEYAARGGIRQNDFRYAGGKDINEVAWYGENSEISTHDVGMKKPNSLGLFDMSGNVEEWCWDIFETYRIAEQKNPKGAETGNMRVKRGGSWLDDAAQCGVFFRGSSPALAKGSNLGFRVCSSVRKKN